MKISVGRGATSQQARQWSPMYWLVAMLVAGGATASDPKTPEAGVDTQPSLDASSSASLEAAAGGGADAAPDSGLPAKSQPEGTAEAPATVAEGVAAKPESAPALDTLNAIMAKVWRENPQVRQAEQALEASGYDITAARAGYLPYLQVQSSLAQKSQDSISTLYVVLPIWQGGLTGAQVDMAKARQRAALAELARTRMDLGQRTIEAYFNVAAAQDQQIQWSNYVGALKKLLATIKRRADQGLAPQADVETAVSRLKQAEAGLEANRAALLTNRARLASLLNATPGALAWPEDTAMLSDEEIVEAKRNTEKHPDHLAGRAEVDLQVGTAHSSRAALWPELSVQHRRQLDGVKFDPSNDATLLVVNFQSSNGIQGLFGWQAERQRIDAAKARLLAIDQEIASTIEVDKAQLAANAAQLPAQYEAARATTALIESFLRQFEAGRRSWLEVLNAQREANENLLQSITLRRNYWFSNAKLALDSMYWNRLGAEIVSDAGEEAIK